jgi:hypothetical protein
VLGGDEGSIYLVTADLGSDIGTGLDFISECLRLGVLSIELTVSTDGFVFLQRFYSVFDTTNTQVGLATTQDTTAETN